MLEVMRLRKSSLPRTTARESALSLEEPPAAGHCVLKDDSQNSMSFSRKKTGFDRRNVGCLRKRRMYTPPTYSSEASC